MILYYIYRIDEEHFTVRATSSRVWIMCLLECGCCCCCQCVIVDLCGFLSFSGLEANCCQNGFLFNEAHTHKHRTSGRYCRQIGNIDKRIAHSRWLTMMYASRRFPLNRFAYTFALRHYMHMCDVGSSQDTFSKPPCRGTNRPPTHHQHYHRHHHIYETIYALQLRMFGKTHLDVCCGCCVVQQLNFVSVDNLSNNVCI